VRLWSKRLSEKFEKRLDYKSTFNLLWEYFQLLIEIPEAIL
jgi:hypothetical protein